MTIRLFIACFLITVPFAASSQEVFTVAEFMPCLEGCENISNRTKRKQCTNEKIESLLADNLKMPKEVAASGESGTAVISVVVTPDGKAEMTIAEDPGQGMGEAALKALRKTSKSWKPAIHFGKEVTAQLMVPVIFDAPKPEKEEETIATPEAYTVVDVMPIYNSCRGKSGNDARQCTFQAVTKYFADSLRYPPAAEEAGIEGEVKTSFIIDREGNVTEVQIVDSLGYGCDEEAVRLLESMPQWVAGVQDEKYVKVRMDLPVRFRLRGKD